MIDLSLPCEIEDRNAAAFVAKLSIGAGGGEHPEHCAILAGEDSAKLVFQLQGRNFSLPRLDIDEIDGDVVFIDPPAQRAYRWIRARSPHNTLLVTERCDQLCLMCSQPPKKTHVDLFAHFETACLLAPESAIIGVSGGEPTLYKRALFRLLDRMRAARPDLVFHVLSNAQHFSEEDQASLRRLDTVYWGVPIYSASAELHNEIVGKSGAFDALARGLSILAKSGAAIELRTVLMQQNARGLPQLAEFVANNLAFIDVWAIMQLENAGFARARWSQLFYDHSCAFTPVSQAMAIATLHGVNVALYNFPFCTIAPPWRSFAAQSISDWKRKFLGACENCSAISSCSGFFEWHADDHGYERLAAL